MKYRQLQPEENKVFLDFLMFFLPFIALLALILGIFTSQSINKDMAALKINNASHLEAGANAIQHDISTVMSDLSYLYSNAALQNSLLSKNKKSLAQAAASLQHFSEASKRYAQIRFINTKGKEVIRVNFDQGQHTLVGPEQLQDKSQRSYFTDTFRLGTDQTYVSPLGLNVEQGEIEHPYKPMLRVGVIVIDEQGEKQGIIMLNYLARLLINHYTETVHSTKTTHHQSHFPGSSMILNQDGYWLLSPDKADEWGFMLGKQTTMARKFPEAWQQIQTKNSGNIITPDGYFAFTTVYPLGDNDISSNSATSPLDPNRTELLATDYKWKLVNHIPPRELRVINSLIGRFPWILFTTLIILAAPLLWGITWSRNHAHLLTMDLRHREEQYRLLYQLAPMPYQSLDEEGHIVDINQEWLRTLGYQEDDVLGQHFSDFILPTERDAFLTSFAEFKERGSIRNLVLHLLHKGGTIIIASFSDQILRAKEGHFLRTQSVFQDVTSQHQAHDKLASNLALLESIINTIPSIICIKDHKGRWLLANRLFLDICGLEGVHYQGKTDSELAWHSTHHHDELLSAKQEDGKAWAKGTPQRSEKIFTLPDNRGETVFDIIRQPNFHEGKPQNLLMVGFDITDRKKNENTVRLNLLRFQALCQLHRMTNHDLSAQHAFALETAVKLSESKIGYLHCDAGSNQPTSFTTWSVAGPIHCQTPENTGLNLDDQGLWQECLTSGKTLIHNNLQTLNQRHGLPLGYIPILHHMSTPLLDGDTIIGVLGVANKESPYSNDDAEHLSLFAVNIMAIFKQRQFSLALAQSQVEWLRTIDAISDVVTIQDHSMHITHVNRAGSLILETPSEEIIGQKCYEIFHGTNTPCPDCPIGGDLHTFTPYSSEIHNHKFGKTLLVSASPIFDDQGIVTSVVHCAKDITTTKKLEMQLRQSQKMEAVGTLAGGVAHDFNNILTAVSGYLQLAMMKLPADTPALSDLEEVNKAADRAADMVRQLMLLARKKTMHPVLLDINAILDGILNMLQGLIGEDITVVTDLDQDLWQVMADTGNLKQVLINLTIHARDAMPEGGILTLRTTNTELNFSNIPPESPLQPGKYVMISVEDTGVGMDTVTLDHIFEPFFTPKGAGRGTGLSLAYNIIIEHQGWFEAESSLGKGAVFRFFLPATSPENAPGALAKNTMDPAQLQGHGERILLVEDEIMLNEFAVKTLNRYGYQVSATYSAEEALSLWDKNKGDFDLLFSDVVLPGKNGIQLFEELSSRKPQLKALLTSGYTDKTSQTPLIKEKNIPFLSKPYDRVILLQKIREILISL